MNIKQYTTLILSSLWFCQTIAFPLPSEIITACTNLQQNASCSFTIQQSDKITGACQPLENQLICLPILPAGAPSPSAVVSAIMEAMDAIRICSGLQSRAACRFIGQQGNQISGVCNIIQNQLACDPRQAGGLLPPSNSFSLLPLLADEGAPQLPLPQLGVDLPLPPAGLSFMQLPPPPFLPGTYTNNDNLLAHAAQFKSLSEAQLSNVQAFAKRMGIPQILQLPQGITISMRRVENDIPIFYGNNLPASTGADSNGTVVPVAPTVKADDLWNLGITGSGYVTLGVWDVGGVLTTHQEFNGRVTQVDTPDSNNDHSTHVAGTIISTGLQANAQGVAYQAQLKAYDWNNDKNEMAEAAANGMQVSNHSYGVISGWQRTVSDGKTQWCWYGNKLISQNEDYKFGFYDEDAKDIDEITYDAPYYLVVRAAGNDRDNNPAKGDAIDADFDFGCDNYTATYDETKYPKGDGVNHNGYDTLMSASTAKNVLTVGAIDEERKMTSFSAWGPTDDGRIKPDLVAHGMAVYSTSSSGAKDYTTKSGTSMAAPVVTGTTALLQQYYQKIYNTPMRAATLKGILIHTAEDLGNSGPDYQYGWGHLNAENATQLIEAHQKMPVHLYEMSLAKGGAEEIFLNIPADTAELRATLVWNDVAGSSPTPSLNPTDKILVNDLDLRIVRVADNVEFTPWKLDPSQPAQPATQGDNNLDNVEQVIVTKPRAGNRNYKIKISHKNELTNSFQAFSLIITDNTQLTDAELDIRQNAILAANNSQFNVGNLIQNNSLEKTFTVTNRGGQTLTINGLTVTGTGFSLSQALSKTSIPANDSATFIVKATGSQTGNLTGTVVLQSNDADTSNYTLTLSATVQGASSVNDFGDSLQTDGKCTLREAISNANQNAKVYPDCPITDTIELAAGTYTLSIAGNGENENAMGDLDILRSLTIKGNSRDNVIIQAGDGNTAGIDRVFDVSGNGVNLTLEKLTIRYGKTNTKGGGIQFDSQDGKLTLNEVDITQNTAQRGGGIYVNKGSLAITWSTISNNSATSTSGNGGGGINCSSNCTLSLANSAVVNNNSTQYGGGIITESATIQNSTISGNSALAGGGIMDVTTQVGTINITNSTIYDNHSSVTGYYGGIMLYKSNANVQNSIIAGNTSSGIAANVGNWNEGDGKFTSLGNNLSNTGEWTGATGDLLNKNLTSDIKLDKLALNSGVTLNHLPQSNSVAIAAGQATLCATMQYDQRGKTRTLKNACDIGAVEIGTQSTQGATGDSLSLSSTNTTTDSTTCTARSYRGLNESGLKSINNLATLRQQNMVVTQNPLHGGLQTESGSERFALQPFEITDKKEAADTVIIDNALQQVQFVVGGLALATRPIVQSPCALEKNLKNMGLDNYEQTSEGLIKVPANKQNNSWFYAQAAWFATLENTATDGILSEEKQKTMLVALVFSENGQRWKQYLYPALADHHALQQAVSGFTEQVGEFVAFKWKDKNYRGLPTYSVTSGTTQTGSLTIAELSDQNNDGVADFKVVYPDGKEQVIYTIP